jgi:putative aldouronate transport system substrate-binding protein
MNDGGAVQMLWMYGVEGVHYDWDADHKTIEGLGTEADPEKKTTKNLFESNLKLFDLAETDPYVALDPVIDESFELFNKTSTMAPAMNQSPVYLEYSATLQDEKNKLIAAVTKGEMTGEEAVAKYNEECGTYSQAILEDSNK